MPSRWYRMQSWFYIVNIQVLTSRLSWSCNNRDTMALVTEETQEWSRVECSEMDQMGLRSEMNYSMTKGQRQFSDKKFSFPQAEAVILFYIQREFKLCPWIFSKYLLRINLNLSTRHKTVNLLENIAEKNLPDIKFDDYFYIQ